MKISKTFRLDEDVAKILARKKNATEYLEDLVLADLGKSNHPFVNEIKFQADRIIETIKNSSIKPVKEEKWEEVGAKEGAKEGYPCCSGSSPCRHWIYDGVNDVWRNSITAETKPA